MTARMVAGRLWALAGFALVLAGGTLAGRVSHGALSVALSVVVVVLSLVVLVAFLLGYRPGRHDLEPFEECGWCAGPVEDGVDYCSDFCREAEAREYRVWERSEMVWEVDAPDGHVLYLGTDVELASELYHGEPAGAHLHLTARPAMSGGQS
jgi:predicted nucleic acid-binding Zn ribbon protein